MSTYPMENSFNFLIFSMFITACRGFSNDVFRSDDKFFVKYSHVLWYYDCVCPPQATEVDLNQITENNDGYGKPQYREDSTNCGCTRHWAPRGSEQACEGCDAEYPNTGENRFFFVNSCYCVNCTQNDAQKAMNEMMLRPDSPDDFNYECKPSYGQEGHCLCVTYSGRRGSELAGCTRDLGWYPCPYDLEDYEIYERVQDLGDDYPLEVDKDIHRR